MSIGLDWADKIQDYCDDVTKGLQDMTKMVLFDIGLKLVERSPVGDPSTWKRQPPWLPKNYYPGTFKNNWQLGVDVEPTDIFLAADPTGNNSINRIRLAIPRWPIGHTFTFGNNLPYAQALEDGHSQQCPPNGMVTLTAMEFPTIVEDVKLRYLSGERPSTKRIPS
jgi:hypothetical protein